ncbi:MAG TPA: prolyl oligopeptidase family serine peptidase [Kofleriaceae bacterium]|nr:prolyl oligopeptidase family serine peptidase [Kofleriaceae bacterium]
MRSLAAALVVLAACTADRAAPTEHRSPYPETRRDHVVDTIHGQRVADPYRWLEDDTRPDVQAWMEAQDAFARSRLAALPARDELATRLRQVMYFDAIGAPVHRNGRYFYTRKHADKEKAVVYWKQGQDGAERVLFDPDTWSTDGSAGLGGWWPSRDGRLVAYAKKANNSDESTTYIRDVASGEDLGDVIAGTKYAEVSWAPDGTGFYYTWVPPIGGPVTVADRPGFAELRFHEIGGDPAHDAVVHPATHNPQTFLGGAVSWDGRWLLAMVQHGWVSTDVYVRDLAHGDARWQPLAVGMPANFFVTAWKDRFYVLTNLDAPKYRAFAVDARRTARADWKEIVPEGDATLENLSVVGGKLALTYLRDAQTELAVHELDGAFVRNVALPPLGTSAGISGYPDADTAYFHYTSFTEASVIYETSIATGAVKEWSRVTLPIDLSNIVAEQVRYRSKDGTPITMFLLHRKDARRDGTQPVILYGYGGFGVSLTPTFSAARAVWLERGGMLAIPNLRGGGEYGEDWHRAGMVTNKQNTFDDFIAAARWLVAEGWTRPDKLAIHGGSNGGLLVGAAMTQAPELFRAVVCAVPLLDMVRYHLFGSGKTWIPEYGSADDPAQFKALFAYSPYHRVREGVAYPALLMMSADHDDRVDPMHARKLTAAVQHASSSTAAAADRPAFLRIEQNAGHGGADLVRQQVEANADLYAFLIQQLGM